MRNFLVSNIVKLLNIFDKKCQLIFGLWQPISQGWEIGLMLYSNGGISREKTLH